VNTERVDAVAEALASIGHDGIAAFDRTEPEYSTLEMLYDRFGEESYVKLLGICAATQDYQLNGDAQRFWRELEHTSQQYESLESTQAVRDLLGDFMEADVNARLNSQKRSRLVKQFEADFDEWFVENHREAEPVEVWEQLAESMDNRMSAKTVVLAMKIYDIAHLIRHGEYLEFPYDIPIPCDLQVERVSQTSGITDSDETGEVMDAWAAVMQRVDERLGEPVSLLRIDSVVWQAGQIIGKEEPDQAAARTALKEHFGDVGLQSEEAECLATELTSAM
jgi:N-glycosylase/DNA lyase